jgi:hypothetical protein
MTGPERRRYIRIPSLIPVEYQLLDAGGEPLENDLRAGVTRDLSEGGLCLETTLPDALAGKLAVGQNATRLAVQIAFGQRCVRLPCRVAWTQPNRKQGTLRLSIGVEYIGVPKSDAEAISAYARKMAQRPRLARAALAISAVALAGTLGLATYLKNRSDRVEKSSAAAVADAQAAYLTEQARITKVNNELRWLTEEIDSVDDLLREFEPGANTFPTGFFNSVSDLRQHVLRLRFDIATARKKAAEQQAKPEAGQAQRDATR